MKKYLTKKRTELVENISNLQNKIILDEFTEKDSEDLIKFTSELNAINEVILICEKRGRY